MRLALGAGRSRIVRQLLTESLLLSAMGGALGCLLGSFGRTALPNLFAQFQGSNQIHIPFNWKVFLFTATITMGTGILFGIVPALTATRSGIGAALTRNSQAISSRRKAWSGKAIVAFQMTLSTLLVVAAVLFLRTLINLYRIDPGFRTDGLLLFDINAPSSRYPAPRNVALYEHVEEALGAVPGVEGVSAGSFSLLAGATMNGGFSVQGAPDIKSAADEVTRYPYFARVGTDFLSVMGIPLLAGRNFNKRDLEKSQPVSIINQVLAQRFFPNQNPVGKRFSIETDSKDRPWIEIVGVCANVRYGTLRSDPPPLHFELYRQEMDGSGLTYIVRTSMRPEAIVPSLRAAVRRVDPDLPLANIRTQQQEIDVSLQRERMFASLSASFGLLALVLACVGIYGIMAYTVAQRTNELGIRLALGARRWQLRSMVLRESTWLALAGVLAGLSAALALKRMVSSMLYGLKPADPLSLTGAALLLIAVALISGWIPARRASRLEPMDALRHQ